MNTEFHMLLIILFSVISLQIVLQHFSDLRGVGKGFKPL